LAIAASTQNSGDVVSPEDAAATEDAVATEDVVVTEGAAGTEGVVATEDVVEMGANGAYVAVVSDEPGDSAAEQEAKNMASATTARLLETVIAGSPVHGASFSRG